jgi:hypothetical protein
VCCPSFHLSEVLLQKFFTLYIQAGGQVKARGLKRKSTDARAAKVIAKVAAKAAAKAADEAAAMAADEARGEAADEDSGSALILSMFYISFTGMNCKKIVTLTFMRGGASHLPQQLGLCMCGA